MSTRPSYPRTGARTRISVLDRTAHIGELVAAAINSMLTGAALDDASSARNPQQFIAGGQSALPQDSMGTPWNGDYGTATGDLVEDLRHNFLETGARNNKLKAHEAVDHPAARALTGSCSPDPDRQDPRVPAAHPARRAP
jgi:hypothetical protein